MKILFFFLCMLIFSYGVSAQSINEIKWITEEYPPFNYTEKNDLKGFTVDILMEMWKRVGLKQSKNEIAVLPWARGIAMLNSDRPVCLFGMGINDERKNRYRFVGSIPGSIRVLIAKKEKGYQFSTIDDVNTAVGNKKIGCARGDIGGKAFLDIGGNPKHLYQVNNGEQLVRMLENGRINLMAYNDIASIISMKRTGIDPAKYEIVFTMSVGHSGYAFNKKVPLAVIQKLQMVFDQLLSDGTVMRIRSRYVDIENSITR